jgi:hypothetical protein
MSVIQLTNSARIMSRFLGSVCVSLDFCLRHNQEAQSDRGLLAPPDFCFVLQQLILARRQYSSASMLVSESFARHAFRQRCRYRRSAHAARSPRTPGRSPVAVVSPDRLAHRETDHASRRGNGTPGLSERAAACVRDRVTSSRSAPESCAALAGPCADRHDRDLCQCERAGGGGICSQVLERPSGPVAAMEALK